MTSRPAAFLPSSTARRTTSVSIFRGCVGICVCVWFVRPTPNEHTHPWVVQAAALLLVSCCCIVYLARAARAARPEKNSCRACDYIQRREEQLCDHRFGTHGGYHRFHLPESSILGTAGWKRASERDNCNCCTKQVNHSSSSRMYVGPGCTYKHGVLQLRFRWFNS